MIQTNDEFISRSLQLPNTEKFVAEFLIQTECFIIYFML